VTNWESMKRTMDAEQFHLHATTPGAWIIQAKLLMHAANRLSQDRNEALNRMMVREFEGEKPEDIWDKQLLPVAQLLAGYAIENLMKGILFYQTPLINDEKLDNNIANHNLPVLYEEVCENTGLKMIPETKDFLFRLKQVIVWKGRYPITKTKSDYVKEKHSSHPELQGLGRIQELFDSLMIEVGKMPNQVEDI
jgi:hypothetical protein